ncbi:MAG TPA: hypothetical protein VFV49_10720 [Thermoanaerobaculia bacterium]|nr:hypothetical protein [Thermoanaerobaculia bacterium]
MRKTTLTIAFVVTLTCLAAEKVVRVDLTRERAGSEPARFLAVVGDWNVAVDAGRKVLQVDGRQWIKGQPSAGLAAKARSIYGSKHEDFVDSVKAYAYFPYAVARDVADFHDGEISMRFRLLGGQLDQCAGILFNLKPNGDYLAVRFNGKEDNLVLWTFKSGKRSFVKKGAHDVHLNFGEWHRMKIRVEGMKLTGFLDDEPLLEYTLEAPVSGKVGVWSKTDSVSQFEEYMVTMQ